MDCLESCGLMVEDGENVHQAQRGLPLHLLQNTMLANPLGTCIGLECIMSFRSHCVIFESRKAIEIERQRSICARVYFFLSQQYYFLKKIYKI